MAKKESKEKIERTYNIPLRKAFRNTVAYKKTPKAMRTIREFLEKHMKTKDIRLGMHMNNEMWKHGIKNPPHHIKVHVIKEGETVRAELEGFEFKEAVRSEKKTEPKNMQEKLQEKLGVKNDEADEKESQAPKAEEKTAEAADKKPKKAAPAKKKEQ